MKNRSPTPTSKQTEIDRFVDQINQHPVASVVIDGAAVGRLIFALDATASRQPTWDKACHLQAQMFDSTRAIAQLQVKLCFYRGYDELRSGRWHRDADALIKAMSAVNCLGGQTQIGRLLSHALDLHRQQSIQALVFIGDCIEEPLDDLCQLAGECGLLGLPLFLFQEGHNHTAASGFGQMAKLSHGAHCQFDLDSPDKLKQLLNAVAIYATGGQAALKALGQTGSSTQKLLSQQLAGQLGQIKS